MSTFKKGKVVMLPINQKTNGMICKDITGQDKTIAIKTKYLMEHEDYIGHHLYIVSDDEIKEGDWYYSIQGNRILQATIEDIDILKRTPEILIAYKKIIATTDSSLWRPSHKYASDVILLPQPSQQFIEKFIEEYNKGNIIKDVLVEYEISIGKNNGKGTKWYPRYDTELVLKINPKNNTITIKKVKDSYTREEVIELCKQAFLLYKSDISGYPGLIKSTQEKENKWIEENL